MNVDTLTYAGNARSLSDIEGEFGGDRYFFIQADICDQETIETVMREYQVDTIIHLAAESHVDRSIHAPADFIRTNVCGTFSLLEAARASWRDRSDVHFHHVSTDEVYGSLDAGDYFFEKTPYDPRSPYSSSKAASDHLVRAYFHTYGLPVTISNCSNNYGPYQFPDKLIPLMIHNMLTEKPLPVYGDGKHVRDWLFVKDHVAALWIILKFGQTGESYNIGGKSEVENIRLVELLCTILASELGRNDDCYKQRITYVKDRPGHDRRYAINCDKIEKELGWKRKVPLEPGLRQTVRWYLDNLAWIEQINSGEYKEWLVKNYEDRG